MSVASLEFAPSPYVPTDNFAMSPTASALGFAITEALDSKSSMVSRRSDDIMVRVLMALEKGAQNDTLVSDEVFDRAVSFLWSLPAHVPVADVVVEDDGEIALDWELGPRRLLTVSIGEGPMLRYAAMVGAEVAHGRVAYAGGMPKTLWFLLQKVLA
jgi:hypothetical protein